jgi:hypothetical protein
MSTEVTLDERGQALENEYFRRREQELIEKMRSKLQAEEKEPSSVQCPKCDGNLVETDFEKIKVDVCNNCHGVWLDAGELAQIAHHEENKGSWFGRWF